MKAALLLACLLAVMPCLAQDAGALATRSLAATCATCHGTDGHPVPGTRIAELAGQPREQLLARLHGFRNGTRESTVMHQIAKVFSEAQLERLATYFAAQKK